MRLSKKREKDSKLSRGADVFDEIEIDNEFLPTKALTSGFSKPLRGWIVCPLDFTFIGDAIKLFTYGCDVFKDGELVCSIPRTEKGNFETFNQSGTYRMKPYGLTYIDAHFVTVQYPPNFHLEQLLNIQCEMSPGVSGWCSDNGGLQIHWMFTPCHIDAPFTVEVGRDLTVPAGTIHPLTLFTVPPPAGPIDVVEIRWIIEGDPREPVPIWSNIQVVAPGFPIQRFTFRGGNNVEHYVRYILPGANDIPATASTDIYQGNVQLGRPDRPNSPLNLYQYRARGSVALAARITAIVASSTNTQRG